MASKVLVPTTAFAKMQIKKNPDAPNAGYLLTQDPGSREAQLELSIKFLQEQHRLTLKCLHAEIEALRERNRDLQFQLIFNAETSPKSPPKTPTSPETGDKTEEQKLNGVIARLQRDLVAARGEARTAEAHAAHLQRMVESQAAQLKDLEGARCQLCMEGGGAASVHEAGAGERAELRARLAEAERLVRRVRADAERQRREVPQGVTNLLFDDVSCLKAQMRAGAMDLGFHNSYHFPPLHDYWPRDHRTQDVGGCRGSRRPLNLPDLAQAHASTIYVNHHARPLGNGNGKNKKPHSNAENLSPKSPEADTSNRKPMENISPTIERTETIAKSYPELKVVITKILPELLHCDKAQRIKTRYQKRPLSERVVNSITTLFAGRPTAPRPKPRKSRHRDH